MLETAQRLALSGYDTHIVSLRRLPELTERYTAVKFHELGGPISSELGYWIGVAAVQRRFEDLVERLRPDALLAHVFPANYWAFVYRARHPKVRCVWYCHEPSAFVHDWRVISGTPLPMRFGVVAANPPLQLIDRWLVRYADAIVANSNHTATRVRQIYGRTATVASPGVNHERFSPDMAKESLILTVGRLTRFKRVDLLLRAAAELKCRGYRDVQWVIAGDGEEAPALRRLAGELGLTKTVTFAGRVDEEQLVKYFNRALIVTMTSVGEPFGIVPIEAMAAGAAVVCSDSGGPASTVEHGVSGLHFRSGDVADLAAQLALLLDAPELAARLGQRGREIAMRQYAWEQTTSGIHTVIEGLLAPRTICSKATPEMRGGR